MMTQSEEEVPLYVNVLCYDWLAYLIVVVYTPSHPDGPNYQILNRYVNVHVI